MSIFDPVEKGLKEIEELTSLCLSSGATIVECVDPSATASRIESLAPQGHPVIRWDAKIFKKYDAVGSMYMLSQRKDKPIVIIENIADIPDGDRNIYDDPVLVEKILLHSWKNDTIHLTHPQDGPFQLNKWDYTVIFPVKPGDLDKLRHSIKDENFAFITI